MHTEDEFLDLVNEEDVVVGKKKRSEIYAQGLWHFRVINAFILNSQGKLWIPRRTPDKRVFPSCLDMSVGGHVESGETYEEAFRRETKEELNIDIEKVSYRCLGKLTPKKNEMSAFMKVYEILTDEVPKYNEKDFTEYFWLTPNEFFEKLDRGDKSKGDLPKLIKHFYS